MEMYKAIQELKEDIEDNVVKQTAAQIGQLFADHRNSWAQMETRIEGKVDMVLQALESKYEVIEQKNDLFFKKFESVVSESMASFDKRLDTFDLRLTKIEHSILPKWILPSIICFIVAMLAVVIVLIVRENSIIKNDGSIVDTLRDIQRLIEK